MHDVTIIGRASEVGLVRMGHTVVGLAAAQITTCPRQLTKGIWIKAPGTLHTAANSDSVYVGKSNVTADSDVETGGYELAPGEELFLEVDDPSEVWVVSTAGAQDIGWIMY